MKKRNLIAILFCMYLFQVSAQNRVKTVALDYSVYEIIATTPIAADVDMIAFDGTPRPIDNPENFDRIRYIYYSGNDWDYDTRTLPESWFRLKNLKGIILSNMDHENEAFENALKMKPGLFLSDATFCHTKWHSLAKDSMSFNLYEVSFETDTRIPYNDELEKMAWQDSLTQKDSIYLLAYTLRNELAENNTYYQLIRDSANKWLHSNQWLQKPPLAILDSVLMHETLEDTVKNYAFLFMEHHISRLHLDDLCFRYLSKIFDRTYEYKEYLDEENRELIKLQMRVFKQFETQGYLGEPTKKVLQAIIDL